MRRIISFKQWVNEAISLSQAKEYTKILRTPEAEGRIDSMLKEISNISGATISKRGDRVYVPFTGALVKSEVEDALRSSNYSLKDYSQGLAIDDRGREMRLNKALMKIKREDLVNKVNIDKTRKDDELKEQIMVFSKRNIDIAGMSTGREWQSCMNLDTGSNRRYVSCDIEEGSLICYLTDANDKDLKNPSARILIKPWVNLKDAKDVLYVPDARDLPTKYGKAPQSFTKSVVEIMMNAQANKNGVYELSLKLYPETTGLIDFSNNQFKLVNAKTFRLSQLTSNRYGDVLDGTRRITDREELDAFITALGIGAHTINSDLTVDVVGNVDISELNLSIIPIKFGKVGGDFICSFNKLKSLEGAPSEIAGDFRFNTNLIESFDVHCPQKIGGDFVAIGNNLKSLEGMPQTIGRSIFLSNNKLQSLKGLPEEVNGDLSIGLNSTLISLDGCSKIVRGNFSCDECSIKSLEGGPVDVGSTFYCTKNKISSLKGSPKKVGKDFLCQENEYLISLEGSPQEIPGSFGVSKCSLTTLKGGPKRVNNDFACSKNILVDLDGAPEFVGGIFYCRGNSIPDSEKRRIEQKLKNTKFSWLEGEFETENNEEMVDSMMEKKRFGKINEALPVSAAKKYTSIERGKEVKKRLEQIFKGLAELPGSMKSKRGDRVYFELLNNDHESNDEKSEEQIDIENAFSGTDFKIEDYVQGKAKDKYNRIIKIGVALKKIGREDLINVFNNDKKRQAQKSVKKYIVFSKHPYDIAGMSTDRGWTSCMDIDTGHNKRFIDVDIKEGTIICYAVKSNDMNIKNPSARVLFKPMMNVADSKTIIYLADSLYGTTSKNFVKLAESVINKVQKILAGKYALTQGLYTDKLHGVIDMHSQGYYDAMSGKQKPKTKEVVIEVLQELGIKNYRINKDLTVDVDEDVILSNKELVAIPVNFGTVKGNFLCDRNPITSLEGSPRIVDGFCCSETLIKNLIGCPTVVNTNFSCELNRLDSLEGAPEKIGGTFVCLESGIKSLKGSPKIIGDDFDCSFNKLNSLEGAPTEVGGDFSCIHNKPMLTAEQKSWLQSNVKASSFFL